MPEEIVVAQKSAWARGESVRNNPPRSGLVQRIRYLHYSLSTEKLYVYRIRFFIRWHEMKHPRDMGTPQLEAFLSMLATQGKVSASPHNQALMAMGIVIFRESPSRTVIKGERR